MKATDLMIEGSLLRLLDAMVQQGVPIRSILMRAVAESIVADPSNSVIDHHEADELVGWYVDTMINIGGAG